MPNRKAFESEVEEAVSNTLSPIAARLSDSLYELEMLEDYLTKALADVHRRKKQIQDAVNAFGTP